MSVAETALTKFREICLSLPDTKETSRYGEPTFEVGNRPFAGWTAKGGNHRILVVLEPEHASMLTVMPRVARTVTPAQPATPCDG